jgi:hypothetical protein
MAERKWFKGSAALAIDAWYASDDVRASLRYARDRLLDDPSFTAIVERLETDHRMRDEFEYPLAGALQGSEFESVARQGYLEAIGLALEHTPPVPVTTYWMTGAGNDRFEMHITDEAHRVSITLLVPEVEGGSTAPRSPESWVVAARPAGAVEVRQTSGLPGRVQPSARTADAS